MLIRRGARHTLTEQHVTPESIYRQRRRFLQLGAAAAVGSGFAVAPLPSLAGLFDRAVEPPPGEADFVDLPKSSLSQDQPLNSWQQITTYNNFYELGTDKSDPAANAHHLVTEPWSLQIDGEVAQGGRFAVEDLLPRSAYEERIYPLRCVEGWSMVIPWVGVPLATLLRRVAPTSRAKFVRFETLHDPERLPGQRRAVLPWPYVEGLRIDEAMHPLTLLAVGLYGRELPAQNGAPLRLVVPWKYGFKSIKSIVRITLTEQQPATTWNQYAPQEYGFYANVNPAVAHPRWSQARERRIGEWTRRDTQPFNGFGEAVADLYADLDLTRFY